MGTAAGTCHCGREVETTCSERIDAQTLYIDHQIRSTYTECACFDVERGAYIDGTFEIPTIPVVSLLHQAGGEGGSPAETAICGYLQTPVNSKSEETHGYHVVKP